jgi:hypothetical protein
MNQHASKNAPQSAGVDVTGIETLLNRNLPEVFGEVIRLDEGPLYGSCTPKTVYCTRRPALLSATTHWTNSPAICGQRIPILSTRLMARPRCCTIPGAWRGARGRPARRRFTPAWISSSRATARSRLYMFSSIRAPHKPGPRLRLQRAQSPT